MEWDSTYEEGVFLRSRSYYKQQVKRDRTTGRKPVDGKRVNRDPQLIIDYIEGMRNLDDGMRTWKLEDGVNWIIGFDSYVKDKTGNLNPRFQNNHIFNKGDIVLVDFFGHFGTELTYEHPAIVLKDTYDGIVIAPISSTCYNDSDSSHVDLSRQVNDLGNMPNNCGIKLEQIRFISKKRVLQKFNRVSNTNKLNEIEEVLMKTLTPYSYQQLITRQRLMQTQLDMQNQELTKKDDEIKKLEQKIQLLQQSLNEQQQIADNAS